MLLFVLVSARKEFLSKEFLHDKAAISDGPMTLGFDQASTESDDLKSTSVIKDASSLH